MKDRLVIKISTQIMAALQQNKRGLMEQKVANLSFFLSCTFHQQ